MYVFLLIRIGEITTCNGICLITPEWRKYVSLMGRYGSQISFYITGKYVQKRKGGKKIKLCGRRQSHSKHTYLGIKPCAMHTYLAVTILDFTFEQLCLRMMLRNLSFLCFQWKLENASSGLLDRSRWKGTVGGWEGCLNVCYCIEMSAIIITAGSQWPPRPEPCANMLFSGTFPTCFMVALAYLYITLHR